MQRLINAAKAAVIAIRKLDAFDDCVVARSNLEMAIADAERQAADDPLRITSAWTQSEFSDMACWSVKRGYFLRLPCCSIRWNTQRDMLVINDTDMPHIETRGQLRRLIAALKGGEK